MKIRDFKHIIDKFLKGETSKREEEILQQFENKLIGQNYSEVFQNQKHSKSIQKEVFNKVANATQKSIFVWKRVAVAASFLILIGTGLSFWIFKENSQTTETQNQNIVIQEVTIKTQKNEQRHISLEDGSKITLYGESTLTYPEKFSEKIRKVSLSGEAFFEVAKNKEKPFVVTSQHIETQVLGTSFNIKAYEHQNNIKVTLTSGKVNVVSENQQVTLSPSEQVIYNKSSEVMTTQNIDLQEFTDMKNGILRFSEASLWQVAEKLEDFYNVKISLNIPQESRCQITGTFQKEKLDVVLRQIAFIHQGISYEKISDKHIVIKGLCNQK